MSGTSRDSDQGTPPRRARPAARGSGPRKALGAYAERIAARYVEERGYRILERNVHLRVGEIDLLALHDDQTVFIEVRSRRENEPPAAALESLTPTKQRRMRRAAELYLALHPELPQQGRIDVVAVTLGSTGTLRAIQLVQNAVEGE